MKNVHNNIDIVEAFELYNINRNKIDTEGKPSKIYSNYISKNWNKNVIFAWCDSSFSRVLENTLYLINDNNNI